MSLFMLVYKICTKRRCGVSKLLIRQVGSPKIRFSNFFSTDFESMLGTEMDSKLDNSVRGARRCGFEQILGRRDLNAGPACTGLQRAVTL